MRSPASLVIAFLLALEAFVSVLAFDPTEAASVVSISQTLNLYSYLVDTNQSSELGPVFAPNATANFNIPGTGPIEGLPAIIQHVNAVSNVTSQHALTTNLIQLSTRSTANASTELTATFFGKDEQLGQLYVVYGT